MVKQIKNAMIALAIMVGVGATAQTKVAHIDSQKLLSEMPEMKKAQEQIQKLSQTYENDIQASFKEYQTKAQAYQSEISALTKEQMKEKEADIEKKLKELGTMENNIRQAQQTAAEEIQKKQQALFQPLLEKVKKAVEKVAKAQGVQYVLDGTQGGSIIFAGGKDLFQDVKKELGF